MINRSVMSHNFSQVPTVEMQRSSFDRSHGLKTTFDGGFLVPILVDEALPGDTYNVNMTAFARLATPIFPIMDNMFMETFFFSVPIRLVWDNWQKFNGEQIDPGDSTDFLIPTTQVNNIPAQSLEDYMGIPIETPDVTFNSLHLRAYNLIYNEWFRDQNLQDSVVVDKDDGPDLPGDYSLLRRGKRHDYFTSSLPWPQKGDAVNIPLGDTAPVQTAGTGLPKWENAGGTDPSALGWDSANTIITRFSGAPASISAMYWNDPSLEADLSSASTITINELRQSFQIQRLLERDARGGTRYTEIIRAHFGTISPDQRLQRPEYLGGGSSPINILPVAQTTSTDATSPQANLAAIGTASLQNHGFSKSFTEHCLIIGLVNVRADLTYQQGLNRMYSRQTRFDFYWPALANIGEQTILNKEIFHQGIAADDLVFGYQERYAEYRYKPSQITGKFRSTHPTSLDAWHLSQDFATLPVLGDTFIKDTPPIDRVIAIATEPHFLFDAYISMRCARPMPLFGVPGLIDHF